MPSRSINLSNDGNRAIEDEVEHALKQGRRDITYSMLGRLAVDYALSKLEKEGRTLLDLI